MGDARRCACPCNELLPADAPEHQIYLDRDGVHKQRAYRKRKQIERLDLEAAEAARATLISGISGIRRRGRVTVRGRRRAARYVGA